jgi:beta-1,4-N-acetylglucosaminyltransferase
MIFVTVGTTDFDDLVRAMDELAPTLGEEVVAQTGRGQYVPAHMEHFDFCPSLEPYYSRARLVVAHGGLGTAIEVLERGLKLIGVSNPDRYDHHQDDILRTLSERGHMLWCRRLEDLPQVLAAASEKEFVPYQSPPCRIAEVIRDYMFTGQVKKLLE